VTAEPSAAAAAAAAVVMGVASPSPTSVVPPQEGTALAVSVTLRAATSHAVNGAPVASTSTTSPAAAHASFPCTRPPNASAASAASFHNALWYALTKSKRWVRCSALYALA